MLFVAAALVTVRWVPREPPREPPAEPYLTATLAGLRHLWHDRLLRAVGLAGTAVLFFAMPVVLVLTTHLERQGQAGALGLVVASFAAGGIAGAIGYGAVATRVRRRRVILVGLAGGSVGLVVMATLPPTFALAALAALVGAAFGPVNPVLAVIVQERAPERLRGRVIATLASLSLMAAPLAIAGAGALLEVVSPAAALLVIGAGCLTATAVIAIHPAFRRLERTDLSVLPPTRTAAR